VRSLRHRLSHVSPTTALLAIFAVALLIFTGGLTGRAITARAIATTTLQRDSRTGKHVLRRAVPSSVRIPSGQQSTSTLKPGAAVLLQAAVTPKAWCRIALSHPDAHVAASALRRASGGLAEFSWRVPRDVAAGNWRTTVRCAPSRSAVLHGRGPAASVSLHTVGQTGTHRGAAAGSISVFFPHASVVPATGKGGGSYPPYGALMIAGGSWLSGQGVDVYSNGSDGNPNGVYQCVELVNRLITTRGWSPAIHGNANELYGNASGNYFAKYNNGSGYSPVPGDIVVWGGGEGGWGHVAVVDANSDGLLTVVEQNASPTGWDTYQISTSGDIAPTAYGYYVEGFLHPKADEISGGGSSNSGGGGSGVVIGPSTTPTGAPAIAGKPAVLANSGYSQIDVFYRDANGDLEDDSWSATSGQGYQNRTIATGVTGNPTAVTNSSYSQIDVFYRDTSGELEDASWSAASGQGYQTRTVGSGVAGDPSAVVNGSYSNIDVFYPGAGGQLEDTYWSASSGQGYQTRAVGSGVAGDPSAVVNGSYSNIDVFYPGAGGQLEDTYWSASSGQGYQTRAVGSGVAGDPAAVANSSYSNIDVFYGGTNGDLEDASWSAASGQGYQTRMLPTN
jgi:hypothetical protein